MCAVVRREGIQSISAKAAFGSSFATSLHIAPILGTGPNTCMSHVRSIRRLRAYPTTPGTLKTHIVADPGWP